MARGPRNPIVVAPGQTQVGVEPRSLRPSRKDLVQSRLEKQLLLRTSDIERLTPILISTDGVIVDGHHAVRAALEMGLTVTVQVVDSIAIATAGSIADLRIRNR